MNRHIQTISCFFTDHHIISISELGNGNINDTYLVTDEKQQFVLQRLNPEVFKKPHLIFENQLKLQQLLQKNMGKNISTSIPQLLLTRAGKSHYKDKHNQYWRGQEFIKKGEEVSRITSQQGQSIGIILGAFHRLGCSDANLFHNTLPGLHATTDHIKRYNSLKQVDAISGMEAELLFCRDGIHKYQQHALCLDRKLNKITIPKRLIHGDPKLANILFDKTSHMACSLIDLDTIGPGVIHHDLSDLLRSCCNTVGEEARIEDIQFDLELAQEILTGYSLQTASFLEQEEVKLIAESLWLIPFELGVRFLNDYLTGSTYFKTSSPRQNILRACNQIQLTKQIRKAQPALQKHINSCFQ